MTESSTVEFTIRLMQKAHQDQRDKAGHPYWTHPFRVMQRLGADVSDETKIVALLHDVFEDAGWNETILRLWGYPPSVAEAVRLLSRPPGVTYQAWIDSLVKSNNEIVIRVKIADNEDNSDPERVAQLPPSQRTIVRRYEKSLAQLRPALAGLINRAG